MGKSKRGGVFGLIRGSVGPATYSVGKTVDGKKQQIVREKPTEVSNPRTRAQAIQRMKLAPIFFMRALLKEIVDHSWKGIANGTPSLYEFMSRAMKEFDVPFLVKGSADKAIGGYVVSDGDVANLMLSLAVSDNTYAREYGKLVPSTDVISLKGIYGSGDESNKTWAGISQKLLDANPWLQDGDEIATLTFKYTLNGGTHGVELIKMRCLIDTHFTTETPDNFMIPSSSAEDAPIFDGNVAYAISLWNPDFDVLSWAKSAYTSATDAGRAGSEAFMALLGFYGLHADGSVAMLVGSNIFNGGDFSHSVIPQVASEVVSGAVAGVAVIVSRKTGDGDWDFAKSDVCLTKGYFELFNSDIRLEAAISSYMSEDGGSGTLSNRFLHLTETDSDVTLASFGITFTPTGGSATNATIVGAVALSEENGARYIFTRNVSGTDYVLDAPNGNVLTATVGGEQVQVTWRMVNTSAEFVDESNVQYI